MTINSISVNKVIDPAIMGAVAIELTIDSDTFYICLGEQPFSNDLSYIGLRGIFAFKDPGDFHLHREHLLTLCNNDPTKNVNLRSIRRNVTKTFTFDSLQQSLEAQAILTDYRRDYSVNVAYGRFDIAVDLIDSYPFDDPLKSILARLARKED